MRLNHDCVRELLLQLENTLTWDAEPMFIKEVVGESPLKEYSREDIAYCAMKLKEAGFLTVHIGWGDDTVMDIVFQALTYEGHRYLDSIRDPGNWARIKALLARVGGSAPFGVVLSIGEQLLMKQLGLG